MLEQKKSLEQLVLDPNNPRFAQSFGATERFPDDAVEGLQEEVLRRFRKTGVSEGDGFFDIDDLWSSMSRIGFVPIDRVVVRKLACCDKHLVIEGNRRVATAKKLLIEDSREPNPANRLGEKIVESLKEVEVLVLETESMSQEEIDHRVSVILGLRHYGSVLEWRPLPKAFNTLTEYMGLDPRQEAFKYENKRVGEVAGRLSVKPGDVRNACMTYIVYQQLGEIFDGVKPQHYSLIEAAVTNRTVTGSSGYLVVDSLSYKMDEPSLAKLNDLCQFADRDSLSAEEKLLREPRDFKHLARLVKESRTHETESVRTHAAGLLGEVESGNRCAESAADSLINFINQKEWVKALDAALDKREEDLAVEEFAPIGIALTHLNEVKATFERLRRVLQV